AAFVIVATAAVLAAQRAVRAGTGSPGVALRAGAGAAVGLAAVGVQVMALTEAGFNSQTHAYGSIFFIVSWFLIVVASAGALMAGLSALWARQGHFTPRRHVPLSNVVRYWLAVTVMWFIGFGT